MQADWGKMLLGYLAANDLGNFKALATAYPNVTNSTYDDSGNPILILATQKPSDYLFELLKIEDINLEIRGIAETTALETAVLSNRPVHAKLLLAAGAALPKTLTSKEPEINFLLTRTRENKRPTREEAGLPPSSRIIHALAEEHKANRKKQQQHDEKTAKEANGLENNFISAINERNMITLQELIDNNASSANDSVNIRNAFSCAATFAVIMRQPEALRILICANADINMKNPLGQTPLSHAIREEASEDDVSIVKMLLAAKAEIYVTFNGRISILDEVKSWHSIDSQEATPIKDLLLAAERGIRPSLTEAGLPADLFYKQNPSSERSSFMDEIGGV